MITSLFKFKLSSLVFPAKPEINALSQMADGQNKSLALDFVTILSDHLKSCPENQILAAIYLLDSILKNVGNPYPQLLESRVICLFAVAFFRLPLDLRPKLIRLLGTWFTHPVFPVELCQTLSSITHLVFGPNHYASLHLQLQIASLFKNTAFQNDFAVLKQLLTVLESQKLDHIVLGQIEQKLHVLAPDIAPQTRILHASFADCTRKSTLVVPDHVPPPKIPPANLNAPGLNPSPPANLNAPNPSLNVAPVLSAPPVVKLEPLFAHSTSILDPNLIGKALTSVIPTIPKRKPLPNIALADIHKTFNGITVHLYELIDLACSQCGMRFCTVPTGKRDIQQHLDWHFRQNKRRNDPKRTISRHWYLTQDEWLLETPDTVIAESTQS